MYAHSPILVAGLVSELILDVEQLIVEGLGADTRLSPSDVDCALSTLIVSSLEQRALSLAHYDGLRQGIVSTLASWYQNSCPDQDEIGGALTLFSGEVHDVFGNFLAS